MQTTLVTVEQLHAQLDNPNWVVIDCRFSLADTSQGERHYSQSRIPGAHYAHLDHHLSSPIIPNETGRHPLPSIEALALQFQHWGINNDTQIIAYDDKVGAIASRLWWLSRWLGHESCAVLDGGFHEWKQAELALETSAPTASLLTQGSFQASKSNMAVINKANVLDDQLCLLDAREAERYKGIHEPIDPVAGHIPGALNAPFIDNLNADGRFKSVEQLQQRFDPILAQCKDKQLTHYCGSGVTAAHNMLAMAYAQRDPGALYAGSFSEWVSRLDDEQFPVVRQGD